MTRSARRLHVHLVAVWIGGPHLDTRGVNNIVSVCARKYDIIGSRLQLGYQEIVLFLAGSLALP